MPAKSLKRITKRSKAAVKRNRNVIGYVLLGYAVTLLLVGASYVVEHTRAGHEVESFAYRVLQGQLAQTDQDLPVVVADITEMDGGSRENPTPRDRLEEIIEALADKGARAVALDIDFSPDKHGLRDPVRDKGFFDFCLKMKEERKVPVFLGVHDAQEATPQTWLGLEKYEDMAVSLDLRPRETRKQPVYVRVKDAPYGLPSLGAALADAYRGKLEEPRGLLGYALDTGESTVPSVPERRMHDKPYVEHAVAPVNYSKLDQIMRERQSLTSADVVNQSGEKFRDKVVILGNGTRNDEHYNVAGWEEPVLGVYLHACVAYTLIREPLYEFRKPVRVGLDFVFSSIIILVAALGHARRARRGPAAHKKERRLLIITVLLTLAAGVAFVKFMQVMWLDFFLVVFALILHTPVEKKVHEFLKEVWARVCAAARAAATDPDDETEQAAEAGVAQAQSAGLRSEV